MKLKMATQIQKRNGEVVPFDKTKIRNAIEKANIAVKTEQMTQERFRSADGGNCRSV
jgi:anaerobic ribonucleoside-triphosphate reductase